jgi:hypothetical protein
VQCIRPQSPTTSEQTHSDPWFGKGICDPNQYQVAIARRDEGHYSCRVFIRIFEQRVKIEGDYVVAMRKWSRTSQKEIEHLTEFGTNKKTWLDLIRASELIAKPHDDIPEDIQRNAVDKMITYEKENYDMSTFRLKIAKQFEKDFENIQKPWLKLLDKLEQPKKSYHEACRKLKKTEPSEKSRKSDNGASKEQKYDVTGSDGVYTKELMALRCEYKKLFDEMHHTRPIFQNSMEERLDRMHDIERKRLTQFRLLFKAFYHAVDIQTNLHLTKMSNDLREAVAIHDMERDLQSWNDNYNTERNNSWPVFEDPIE